MRVERMVAKVFNRGNELGIFDALDVDNEVDAIEDGARELAAIGLDLGGGASTGVGWVAKMTARTGVHGGNKHKVGWISGSAAGAGNRDGFVFKRATERLKNGAGKLGKLVEKEDTVMGEGDFTRGGRGTAANNRGGTRGVVWCAEGTLDILEAGFGAGEGLGV